MRSKTVDRLLKSTPKDVEIFVDWYADLVVRINQLLRENNINKKELAERMDKKPSEISKWLNGEHNFTLRSLAKLSAELGENLFEVPKRKAKRYSKI
jgi:transcriptional regulator with XRE-family HTH domain